jgi:tRNA(Ile)-lysidine synthase
MCRRSSEAEQGSHKPRVRGSSPRAGTIVSVPARFLRALCQDFPDLTGRHCLVALSGGADSVALLRLLRAVRKEAQVQVSAAHVHHHLRGADADADAAFCLELCRSLDVPLALLHLDPEPPRHVSPEAWWRRERYRLLEEEARRQGCTAVLTAHTLDDQAETVLTKLLTGGGPRAAAGIRRRRGIVVRPLLDLRRAELRVWLGSIGGGWREDATNAERSRPRGYVRHELLPRLEARFPGATEHLAAFADSTAAGEEILGQLLRGRAEWPRLGAPVELAAVRSLGAGLRTRWVLELAGRLPLREPPSRAQLAAVEAMLQGGRPAAVDLGRRWVLRRTGDRLRLCPPPCSPFAAVPVLAGDEQTLPGGFVARLARPDPTHDGHRASLRADVLDRRLCWRSPRPGERWPSPGGRRLATLLAAAGVPAEWRRAWPLLEADGTILWAPGLGVAPGWEAHGGGVPAEVEEPWRRRLRSCHLM